VAKKMTLVSLERKRLHQRAKEAERKNTVKEALAEINRLEDLLDLKTLLRGAKTEFIIRPPRGKRTEAIAVAVASDWHVAERVRKSDVNGRNEFNLAIAKIRAQEFFVRLVKLLRKEQQDVEISTVILALLGDFITNNEMHHSENAENLLLEPTAEALYAFQLLSEGIEYILRETKANLIIPCHSGNHGRTTENLRVASEQGHSYEFFIYVMLKERFGANKRITFIIAEGYHSYVKAFDFMIRFHHGHNVRYHGGVGGITIPVNKAIAQWNRLEVADLDVFGHFHQFFDGGNFICNGSLIGYNAYALSIKAAYEPPRQALFLVNSKFGKSMVTPVFFSDRPR